MSHNPYFSGNLFAIINTDWISKSNHCHNPYFSGNLFAIYDFDIDNDFNSVTILILVETSLQLG